MPWNDVRGHFASEELAPNGIHAAYFTRNPASGRVLEKAGMRLEGVLRQHVEKWGTFEDLAVYGILASDVLAGGDREGAPPTSRA